MSWSSFRAGNVASCKEKTLSTELNFTGSRGRKWLRVGPLADEPDAFAALPASLGHSRRIAISKLRLVRCLSHWMALEEFGFDAFDECRTEAFLSTRKHGHRTHGEAAALRLLLDHLRDRGRREQATTTRSGGPRAGTSGSLSTNASLTVILILGSSAAFFDF